MVSTKFVVSVSEVGSDTDIISESDIGVGVCDAVGPTGHAIFSIFVSESESELVSHTLYYQNCVHGKNELVSMNL